MNIYISVGSVLVGIGVIFLYKIIAAVEGSFIILSILGAPLTFCNRLFWMFGEHSRMPFYTMYFLYFLQYQLVAVFVNRLVPTFGTKAYAICFIIIFFSGMIMFFYQSGAFVR